MFVAQLFIPVIHVSLVLKLMGNRLGGVLLMLFSIPAFVVISVILSS